MIAKIRYMVLLLVIALLVETTSGYAEIYDWGTEGVADIAKVEKVFQLTGNPYFSDTEIDSYSDPWSSDGDWIVYTVTRYDSDDEKYRNWLYKIRPDGKDSIELTGNVAGDTNARFTNASFATDGRIYFERNSYIDGSAHIYSLNRDGTLINLSAVHGGEDCERFGRPSPDASLVAYNDCSSNELRVVNSDGTSPKTVSGTQNISAPHHDWSPDSQWLAYKGNDSGNGWVYIVNRDGILSTALTKPSLATFGIHTHRWPTWSPDGRVIAFIGRWWKEWDSSYDYSLKVVAVDDGENQQSLDFATTLVPGWQDIKGPLSWSPDGKWIAYYKTLDTGGYSYRALFISPIDGSSGPIQLTTAYHDFTPFWSPDGSKILFQDRSYQPSFPSRDGNSYDDLLMLKMKGSYGKFPWPIFLPAITTGNN